MEKIILQKDLFPTLIRLNGCNSHLEYPVGSYMPSLLDYTESAAKKLVELFPGDNIALIVRGTSGAMIGGLIASRLIYNAGICVKVIISRKPEDDCHATNLEDIDLVLNYKEEIPFRLVVADDFISSGNTLYKIVRDVESYIGQPFIFDALVVHNNLICNKDIEGDRISGDLKLPEEGTIAEEMLLTKFLNILCL
jgi:hypothetical protein